MTLSSISPEKNIKRSLYIKDAAGEVAIHPSKFLLLFSSLLLYCLPLLMPFLCLLAGFIVTIIIMIISGGLQVVIITLVIILIAIITNTTTTSSYDHLLPAN